MLSVQLDGWVTNGFLSVGILIAALGTGSAATTGVGRLCAGKPALNWLADSFGAAG